jgi:hypothetical protein
MPMEGVSFASGLPPALAGAGWTKGPDTVVAVLDFVLGLAIHHTVQNMFCVILATHTHREREYAEHVLY